MHTMTKAEAREAVRKLVQDCKLSAIDNALADAGMSPGQITPILQRVKHHDELVAALRRCLPQVEFTHLYQQRTMTAAEAAEIAATLAQARATLAKVTP